MNPVYLKNVIEAALLAAAQPLSLDQLMDLFEEANRPDRKTVREALQTLGEEYSGRGIELAEVASGFRVQVRGEFAPAISRLWLERPPRYSRALMETLALIAYRQPITRGEIEEIRGVAVSTNIMRSLLERGWARVVGHRDVPGRPAMYGTTREFLDYFGLKSLDELPPLAELRDPDRLDPELDLLDPERGEFMEEQREEPLLRVVSSNDDLGQSEDASAAETIGDETREEPRGVGPIAVEPADEQGHTAEDERRSSR